MMKAPVNDVFISIQGEGIFVGDRQTFVRFYGCNLACSYCDTKLYTWQDVSAAELRQRVLLLNGKDPTGYVSFTGGEPLLYAAFLKEAIPRLRRDGFRIYLETAGILYNGLKELAELVDVVAMDIKLPSSSDTQPYWGEHERFLKISKAADSVFVKAVITKNTKDSDFEKAVGLIRGVDKKMPFVIQPVSSPDNPIDVEWRRLRELEDMAKAALEDVRIVPQMHKTAGVK